MKLQWISCLHLHVVLLIVLSGDKALELTA